MIEILSIAAFLIVIYFMMRPETEKQKETKKFGEGLLQDKNDISIKK